MKFKAEIDVMPLDELLDPQGKVVANGLHSLSMKAVKDVRIGKHMTLNLEADNKEEAQSLVDNACKQLLVNPVIEKYNFYVYEC